MSSLRAWFRRNIRRDRDLPPDPNRGQNLQDDPEHLKELPFLPASRPRCLTPTAASFSSSSSPFFQRLPAEIRREIYVQAFGSRTLHIDLTFQYMSVNMLTGPHNKVDALEPNKWRWQSCVCHRDPRVLEMLNFDKCRATAGWARRLGNGDCWFIGVMGWLLTCRQAYIEAIDILYSTNTMFMTKFVLASHLPKLLLPDRLATITSLEFFWDMKYRPLGLETPFIDSWQAYKDLIPTVDPSTFPSLQKLYIFIHGLGSSSVDFGRDDRTKHHAIPILHPADEIARRFDRQLKKYTIAFPARLFDAITKRIDDAETMSLQYVVNADVDSRASDFSQFRRNVQRPSGGQEFHGSSQEDLGYWVRTGVNDRPSRPR